MGDVDNLDAPVTFAFPITNQERAKKLKKIPPNTLPKFYGLVTKDLDTFMFEFDVLCRSYNYVIDAHHLKKISCHFEGFCTL